MDYAVELLGSLFMMFIVFVGDSILYQRILFCIGTFLYGIPIPLAFLLNEARVRDIIVNEGWMEGFKAIFHSETKIRNQEREKVANFQDSKKEKKVDPIKENNDVPFGVSSDTPRQENGTPFIMIAVESSPQEPENMELAPLNTPTVS